MTTFKKLKSLTTAYSHFDPTRVSFTDVEENERSNGQLNAYVRYNCPKNGEDSHLNIQLPFFEVSTYGIPQLGKYYEKDSDRAFIKAPLDQQNEEVKVFITKMSELDDIIGSDEFKKKNLGKKWKKYTLCKNVREMEEDDEGNARLPYMKMKFKLDYQTGEFRTSVYSVDEDDNTKECHDDIKTVTDATQYIKWKSTIRPIIRAAKLWAHNPKTSNPQYGITWKIEKIQVRPSPGGNTVYKSYYSADNDAFLSDDDDTNESVKLKVVEENGDNEDSESSESDSDSESEDEEVQPVKKSKSKGKTKKKSSNA